MIYDFPTAAAAARGRGRAAPAPAAARGRGATPARPRARGGAADCPFCGKVLPNATELRRRHMPSCPARPRPECAKCGQRFKTLKQMSTHHNRCQQHWRSGPLPTGDSQGSDAASPWSQATGSGSPDTQHTSGSHETGSGSGSSGQQPCAKRQRRRRVRASPVPFMEGEQYDDAPGDYSSGHSTSSDDSALPPRLAGFLIPDS